MDSCEADPKFSLQYYNLEQYLFTTVHDEFHRDKQLDVFDFFSIVIWKANRAKSRVAQRLLRGREGMTLDQIVAELTSKLAHAESPEERLKILLSEQYGFRLPIASAILTVLWPDEFTVFDARVCERLREFKSLADTAKFDRLWSDYRRYVDAVKEAIPGDLGLRDKDRVLWARSAAEQLKRDIACNFMHTVDAREE